MMDACDAAVLILGLVGAIGNGVSNPLLSVILGDIINVLGEGGEGMMKDFALNMSN